MSKMTNPDNAQVPTEACEHLVGDKNKENPPESSKSTPKDFSSYHIPFDPYGLHDRMKP